MPPIFPVRLPSSVQGQQNGDVDRSLLSEVDDPNYTRLMLTPCAEAMRALHVYAATAGIRLSTTGRGRTLASQWLIFGGAAARYRPCTYPEYLAARLVKRHKKWLPADRARVAARLNITIPDSTYWCKIRNPNGTWPATVATPGTSNHGWWAADDLAEIVNGRRVSLRITTRDWLYANAPQFGFGWESKAEPWHVAWIMGDQTPPALKWGSEMQRIRMVNDYAILKLVGDRVEWVQNAPGVDVNNSLEPVTGPVIVLERPAFAVMHGHGKFPTPTNLLPTDFASWQP